MLSWGRQLFYSIAWCTLSPLSWSHFSTGRIPSKRAGEKRNAVRNLSKVSVLIRKNAQKDASEKVISVGRNSPLRGDTTEQGCEFLRIQLTQKVGGMGERANRISDWVDLNGFFVCFFFFLNSQILTAESHDYFQAWDGSIYSCWLQYLIFFLLPQYL